MLLRSCRALAHYLDATLTRSSLALTHYLDAMLLRSCRALTHYLDATLTRSSLALTHYLDAMLLCSHVVMLACSHAQRAGTGGAQDGRKISRLKRACTHTHASCPEGLKTTGRLAHPQPGFSHFCSPEMMIPNEKYLCS